MEKGGDTDSSSHLDKKTSSNSDFHPTHTHTHTHTTASAAQPKILIMASPLALQHQHQHHHPFLTNDAGGTAGEAAPLGVMYSPSVGGAADDFGRTCTILQPFDNFHPSGAGTATVFPFTHVQWKELERQAMIYKCMISSVPVPPHLLFPIDSCVPIYGGGYSRKGDAEPGRCKRTDGKKWRCSREVAPQQKYCERHLHRGRPRSRKPVEPKTNSENHKKTRLDQTKTQNDFKPRTDLTIPTPYYKGTNSRDSGIMEANIGLSGYSSCSFDQDYAAVQQPLNLFCYPHFSAPEMELPTGFIDAWSIDHMNSRNKGSVESSISVSEGDVSPSLNLSMAMAVGSSLDEQMRNIQTDWQPFAGGGPLAEALQPVSGSNPASPYNSISNPATTVSSPSGVLHWTLFSHSDGSVCNSPTLAAPDMSNQWQI